MKRSSLAMGRPAFKSGLLLSLILISGMLVLQLAGPLPIVHAATFDIPPGDVPALVYAINQANASSGPSVINLSIGSTYVLTTSLLIKVNGPNGLPTVTSPITINGNGATIIRSPALYADYFRIFYVSFHGNLTLNDITLRNGRAEYDSLNDGAIGGAIFNNAGILTINNSMFIGNQAYGGGVIGNMRVNTYDTKASLASFITINNSTFIDNKALVDGGVIFNYQYSLNTDEGPITNSIRITGSTFVHNDALEHGDGRSGIIYNYVTGADSNNNSTIPNTINLSITNSTFYDNISTHSELGQGIISNAAENGADINLDLTNNTFANNKNPALYSAAHSYGNWAPASILIHLKNSLMVNNTGGNCTSGYIVSYAGSSHNLEYTDGSPNATPTCPEGSTYTTTNPLSTNGLANNGGPTQTIALAANSPAIDAGDAATCADPTTVNNRDQRGAIRPQASGCDIGAYEYGAPTLAVTPTVLNFSAKAGGPDPAVQNLTIANPGDASGPFDWNVSAISYKSGSGWLNCTPGSGTGLAPGASNTISCQASVGSLSPGIYSATFQVASNTAGVGGSPVTVYVEFKVAPTATLTVAPQTLHFYADWQGANPAAQNLTIGNIAGASGPLDWSLSSIRYAPDSGLNWLNCIPVSGTNLAPGASVNASCKVNVNGIGIGTYIANFEVIANTPSAANPILPVEVVFEVTYPLNIVTLNNDNGLGDTFGTLSYALKNTTAGQAITFQIVFNSPDHILKIDGPLPPVKTGVAIQNTCQASANVIIDGTGVNGDGLVLSGGNDLSGFEIKGFSGRQIVADNSNSQGANTFHCVKVHK